MKPFEYLLVLAVVILGLAVTELALSLSRLANAKGPVRWGALAPLAAVLAFLKIVSQWWVWFSAERVAEAVTFERYLYILVEAVLLFLLAATALPNHVSESGTDLREWFERVRRRFWLLFLAQWLLWITANIWIKLQLGGVPVDVLRSYSIKVPVVVGVLVLAVFVRNRIFQGIVLALFSILYLLQSFGTTLS